MRVVSSALQRQAFYISYAIPITIINRSVSNPPLETCKGKYFPKLELLISFYSILFFYLTTFCFFYTSFYISRFIVE